MSRAPSTSNDPGFPSLSGLAGPPGVAGGAGFNRQPLTPEQQMQALKRVQAQAEQRVKLGMQLFKAAEARLSSQTDVLQQIKTLQKQLREQVNTDVAQSLHQYDQWIGQIDESFTNAIRKLEEKVDAVQANVTKSEAKMGDMLDRAEALLDQSRCLLEQNSLKMPATLKPLPPIAPAPPATKNDPPPASAAQAIRPIASTPPPAPTIVAPPSPWPAAGFNVPLFAEIRPAKPTAPPPSSATDAGSGPVPHVFELPVNQDDAGHEKIYSKLLQRLIEEPPTAPGNTASTADPDDAARKDEGNADAAA